MKQTTRTVDYTKAAVNPIFARHQTFHPRFSWLKKGFDLALQNPSIFLQEDAPVCLGVGKNMVNAIRYWCNAFKVLEEEPDSSNKGRSASPSDFGSNLLLDDRGWDPFLEDPASLWLLHWNLLKPTCDAAAWYYTFNLFREVEFTADNLMSGLELYKKDLKNSIVDTSLKKDLTCILRMYASIRDRNGPIEDSIDCPFTELGLIHQVGDSKSYAFRIGAKSNLPALVLVATCLEYASIVSQSARTIAVSRLLYDPGSPGMAFKLTQSAICEAIEQVARSRDSINLSETAGLIQFFFNEEPAQLGQDILEQYYQGKGR